MASSKEYLHFVLEQCAELDGLSFRPMMGEYVIYYRGKVVGGVYDNRFLLKPTKTVLQYALPMEIPYEGAKAMIAADIENRDLTRTMIQAIAQDLPEPKRRIPTGFFP